MRFNVLGTGLSLLVMSASLLAQGQGGRAAVFTGKVFAESLFKPIAEAEVLLPDLARSALTDNRGAFRIVDIPSGTHLVRVRRVGFLLFEALIEFRADQTTERPIVLPRLSRLDSVRVVGELNVPLSYLEHRAAGFGHFMTRAELERQGDRKIGDVISQISGLGLVRGRSNQTWILSKRTVPRLGNRNNGGENTPGTDFYSPSPAERARGLAAGCYARVYLDNMLLNAATPAEPVNVNEFFAGSVEAIEYYSGPAQTPMKYSRLNTTCGVLVLHTRRSR